MQPAWCVVNDLCILFSAQFINTAAERQHLTVDHKLSGGTKKISAIRCTINQGEDRRQIVLVDTVPSNSEYFNHKMREWMKQQ